MSIKRPSSYQLSRTLGSLLILAASSFAADGALADNKGRDDVVIATPLGATGKVALQGQLVRVVDPSAANCAPAPDFSALDAAIKSQIVHLARLDAQYHGRADIVLPEELRGQQNSEPIANALRDERNALVAGAQALDANRGDEA